MQENVKTTTDLETVKAHPRRFTWGRVIAFHHAGRYDFVEYEAMTGLGANVPAGVRTFHAYVDGESTRHGYPTLETALLGAMASAAPDKNPAAAVYAARVLGLSDAPLPV